MKKKILLIENYAEDFYKARLPLAVFLLDKGYDVYALVPEDQYVEKIKSRGINVLTYPFNRKDKGLFQFIKLAVLYRRIVKNYNFDIVHSFRFQPNLLNSISSMFLGHMVVLHITGLGIAFSNESLKYIILKGISKILYLLQFLRANKIIVQNPDDINDFIFKEHFQNKICMIPGSGVDINRYKPYWLNNEKKSVPDRLKFICITRLIWEKGVFELTEAFKSLPGNLKDKVELNIIGWVDIDNPRAISQDFIESFATNPDINFLEKKSNVIPFLHDADVFIYPSYYREGIPRSILEALAVGLPIITTNTPGCNLTTKDNVNGFLIESRSISSIVDKVSLLYENIPLLTYFGQNSRKIAETEFSEEIVFNRIEKIYVS